MQFNQLTFLLAQAGIAAKKAGAYINNFNRAALNVSKKVNTNAAPALVGTSLASQVVTQVDIECEKIILNCLKATCQQFDLAFLGEESANELPIAQHPRLKKAYFWCVDPLDGTLPFTENVPGYAVSIALVSKQGKALLGVVYDPVEDMLYQAIAPHQASTTQAQAQTQAQTVLTKNNLAWQPEHLKLENIGNKTLDLFFDRSFASDPHYPLLLNHLTRIANNLGFKGVNVHCQAGSVLNAIKALTSNYGCYFKLAKKTQGGGCLWDFAASAAIANAANLWVSDINGKALTLNAKNSLFMNQSGVLYASHLEIAKCIIDLSKKLKT